MTTIRDVQLAELKILKEAIKILDRHNLRYFMIGGTMLGAVRHQGFIPWDDDIDIALPRKDYELFLQYAKEELPEPYKVLQKSGKHDCLYAKIHNTQTTFVEPATVDFPEYYKGVFIDVMPMSGMPENEKARRKHCKKIAGLVKAFNWHRFNFKYCKTWKAKLLYLIPEKWIFKKWQRLCKKYDFDESTYTCFSWSHRPARLTFESSCLKELAEYDFEGIKVKGAKDFDGYLKAHFGADYMQLPPEEARQSHSDGKGIIDLKQSYLIYKQGENKQ